MLDAELGEAGNSVMYVVLALDMASEARQYLLNRRFTERGSSP